MKVTICELRNELDDFAHDWEQLISHVNAEASDLVLLPEMSFYPWLAWTREVDPAAWQRAVAAHDEWLARFQELSLAIVVGTRPVTVDGRRLNEGFVWESGRGYRAVHAKYYLPNEERFWEASWCWGPRSLITEWPNWMSRERAQKRGPDGPLVKERITGVVPIRGWRVWRRFRPG